MELNEQKPIAQWWHGDAKIGRHHVPRSMLALYATSLALLGLMGIAAISSERPATPQLPSSKPIVRELTLILPTCGSEWLVGDSEPHISFPVYFVMDQTMNVNEGAISHLRFVDQDKKTVATLGPGQKKWLVCLDAPR